MEIYRKEVLQACGMPDTGSMESLLAQARYERFHIRKRSGQTRVLFAPDPDLKALQRHLARYLTRLYRLRIPRALNPAHGFLPGRSIVSNARPHVGRKYLLNIDLKDYFHRISADMVKYSLTGIPFRFTPEAAALVAHISCHSIKPGWLGLPQGAPTSPILANIVTRRLDKALKAYAIREHLIYTRYADDLTFSAMYRIGQKQAEDIKALICKEGFRANRRKIWTASARHRLTVTGLCVNQKVNVQRRYVRQLRAFLHRQETDPEHSTASLRQIRGHIDFLHMVRGREPLVQRFYDRLIALEARRNEKEAPP